MNVALAETESAAGPVRRRVSGGAVSTVQDHVAGVGSALPAASTARTAKLCGPSVKPARLSGVVQEPKAAPSSEHSNVAGDSVDVRLAVDAAFAIDVEDERTKARGFVRGTGDPARYGCKIEMVDSRDEMELGDLIVTSGKGHWFPRGIPVARVTKVVKRELGRDQEVEAAPTVDFSRLDVVLILVASPNDEAQPTAPTATAPRGKP